MPEKRDYPPSVIVHRPDCPDAQGRPWPRLATAEVARRYPNGKQHHCYHFHQNSIGVVEQVEYAPHEYEKSTVTYPDATRALCGFCGGTHGVLDALDLPPGVRTVAPPRQE
jgi:hypothetical protein